MNTCKKKSHVFSSINLSLYMRIVGNEKIKIYLIFILLTLYTFHFFLIKKFRLILCACKEENIKKKHERNELGHNGCSFLKLNELVFLAIF